ncbi:unnamed protein product [Rhizopus stolonifer]
MKGPATFYVKNEFFFSEEDCYKYNLPLWFISLKASSWLKEKELARKFVLSNEGVVDAETEFSSIIQGFKKLKDIKELPESLTAFAKYTALDKYSVENAKEQATNNILKENYRIHGELSIIAADNIIQSATSSKGKDIEERYESDASCKSEDYHPRRTRIYAIDTVDEDNESAEDMPMIRELREFRRRSVELTKTNVNQVSDLRLLSLEYIYLFSENINKSVTKYLGTEAHQSYIPLFSNEKPNDIDLIVFKWCMQLTNFTFQDNNDKWMELQKATIGMLGEAIAKYEKKVVQVANLLHIITPRLLINSNESNVEDTYIHNFFSYIIKLVFGIEDILKHQWANGRLNQADQNGKFKPDYVAYMRTRSTRHDLTVAEVKPTGVSSGKPPSDLVKLGQQMKVMLNNLISHKIPSPITCGILVEGKNCSLYKMDLIGQSFYRMVLLTSFPLCTTPSELCLIPNVFMWMTYIKDITIDTANRVEKSELTKAKGKRKLEDVVPESWMRHGTCTFKYKKTNSNK